MACKETENPIKGNRIVHDMTFAERFLSFVEETSVCDAMGEEEKEYLLGVARRLLDWQAQTATDEAEVSYLKRIGIIDGNCNCKHREENCGCKHGHEACGCKNTEGACGCNGDE